MHKLFTYLSKMIHNLVMVAPIDLESPPITLPQHSLSLAYMTNVIKPTIEIELTASTFNHENVTR